MIVGEPRGSAQHPRFHADALGVQQKCECILYTVLKRMADFRVARCSGAAGSPGVAACNMPAPLARPLRVPGLARARRLYHYWIIAHSRPGPSRLHPRRKPGLDDLPRCHAPRDVARDPQTTGCTAKSILI